MVNEQDPCFGSCWQALLQLKEKVSLCNETVEQCSLCFDNSISVLVNEYHPKDAGKYVVHIQPSSSEIQVDFSCYEDGQKSNNEVITRLLKSYLPYCFFSIYAKQKKRSLVVSHFAQSLDAKIATNEGDSRWIGNDCNLVHSHRMRAICDAVAIGQNTLLRDNPKLTTRHVEGPHPSRVILGANASDLKHLGDPELSPVIVFSCTDCKEESLANTTFVTNEQKVTPPEVLEELFRRGIYSVYLEGGATTTSCFIENRCVDMLQIHISPLLFGSGVSSFAFNKPISKVENAIRFNSYEYVVMGDAVMFVGTLENTR